MITAPPPSDPQLLDDLALLTELHDQVLREAGQDDVADRLRQLREHGTADFVADLDPDQGLELAAALTVRLHLANLADERHRVRVLQQPEHAAGVDAGAELWPALSATTTEALQRLRIHPVLTAHPTEARRRAVSTALRRIARQLQRHDDPAKGAGERWVARRRLLEEIDVLQRTSALRATRPGPLDEVRTAMAVFDETLFRAVPRLYRATEVALIGPRSGLRATPVPAFVRFGSWVGGDRDGNPLVTAEITRQTMSMQSEHALTALLDMATTIARALTDDQRLTPASRELTEALARDAVSMPQRFAEIVTGSPDEPHRQKLLVVSERLAATRAGQREHSYAEPGELLADLRLVQRSLAAAGAPREANGELQHLIWLVETFGFHLAELELRQHSGVHRRALVDLLGQLRDVTDPQAAAGDAAFLDQLATSGWPQHVTATQDVTREVLDTLRVLAWLQQRWGADSCGRYIVSFSQSAADLVAVRALARLAVGDAALRLDVVPLFETGADLEQATDVLDDWLLAASTRSWLRQVDRAVEVMLGYSDSAKDVGPTAATLGLADAETALVAWARRHGIALTLFHGRGGSLGRGGGPLHRAITAQPPGSVAGRFKVTEQGEVVLARYADTTIAQRHLERVTTAVLLADTDEVAARNAAAARRYADLAATLSAASRTRYRALLDTPGFADVLAEASPLDEIGELRMGSRPVRRSAATSGRALSDLRAIPWVFAWSQTRANIPGWYGLGTALRAAAAGEDLTLAYRQWPLFAALIDVAEMSLAKSHRELAAGFLALGERPEVTEQILAELDLTVAQVLAVLGQDSLLQRKPSLASALALRMPYVDALSQLQLRALTAVRRGASGPHGRRAEPADARDDADADADAAERWRRLLLLTVNGAAAGLQNTG